MTDSTRRTVLRRLGAASTAFGFGSTTALAQGSGHELCINAPSDRSYPYAFTVDGSVEKVDDPAQAPIDSDVVTVDVEDDPDGCVVRGYTRGGWDCYRFSGDLLAFDLPDQWVEEYNVYFDGESVHPNDLWTGRKPDEVQCAGGTGDDTNDGGGADTPPESNDEKFCPYTNDASFGAEPKSTFEYRFTTNEGIELRSGRRVEEASGTVRNRGGDSMMFAGEVDSLRLLGAGHATLLQQTACSPDTPTDVEKVPAGGAEGWCPFDNELSIESQTRHPVTVVFGTTAGIQRESGGPRPNAVKFTIPENRGEASAYYAGEVTFLAVDGPARIYIDQPNPCR